MTFYEGSITLDFDSGEDFHGIGIFCRFFALKDFLSYRPLKKVWADRPTAVRFRVKRTASCDFHRWFFFHEINFISRLIPSLKLF